VVVHAINTLGAGLGARQGRQKHGGKKRDDCDDHQQLEQGEGAFLHWGCGQVPSKDAKFPHKAPAIEANPTRGGKTNLSRRGKSASSSSAFPRLVVGDGFEPLKA